MPTDSLAWNNSGQYFWLQYFFPNLIITQLIAFVESIFLKELNLNISSSWITNWMICFSVMLIQPKLSVVVSLVCVTDSCAQSHSGDRGRWRRQPVSSLQLKIYDFTIKCNVFFPSDCFNLSRNTTMITKGSPFFIAFTCRAVYYSAGIHHKEGLFFIRE